MGIALRRLSDNRLIEYDSATSRWSKTKKGAYIAGLKAVVEEGLKPIPIFDRDGRPTGLYRMRNTAGALEGLEKLGKIIGMF